MALIKCKECSNEVSDKAKKCPHCGAKIQKPVGPLGIILALIVGWFFYSAVSDDTSSPKVNSSQDIQSSDASRAKPKQNKEPKTTWHTSISIDEMTGETQAYAMSKRVPPTRRMGFPYSDIKAWAGVGCDGSTEWAFFGFTTAPIISNDETKSGYNVINTRIKWNESIQSTRLIQDWGAKFIHFANDSSAISKFMSSSQVMLELNWHGEGRVNFDFPLKGSADSIREMRQKCK